MSLFTAKTASASAKARVVYQISTGLMAAAMLFSSVVNLTLRPLVVNGLHALGYPSYMPFINGMAEMLGGLGLLLPLKNGLKEWVYAGLTYLFIGAALSHAFMRQPAFFAALLAQAVLTVSYLTRPRVPAVSN